MTASGTDPDLSDDSTGAVVEEDAPALPAAGHPPTGDEDEEAAAAAAGTDLPESVPDAYEEAAGARADPEGTS